MTKNASAVGSQSQMLSNSRDRQRPALLFGLERGFYLLQITIQDDPP